MIRLCAVLLTLALTMRADSLTLRDGTTVTGAWVSVDSKEVTFLVDHELRSYPRTDVSMVTFGSGPAAQPKAVAAEGAGRISKGETKQQVMAALGDPDRVSGSNGIETYYYKNLKVIFVDGKVTDVQ